MRGNLRYIDYSSADERAAIGDPHDYRTPVFLIVDANQCPEGPVATPQLGMLDPRAQSLHWTPRMASLSSSCITKSAPATSAKDASTLFDRLAGPSWLARQFSGSARGIVTSALVGVAGAFVGYHIAVLALAGGLLTSVIAAAAGAAVVLFVWRMAK